MATAAEVNFNPRAFMQAAGLTKAQIDRVATPYLIGYLSAFVSEERMCIATDRAIGHALKEKP